MSINLTLRNIKSFEFVEAAIVNDNKLQNSSQVTYEIPTITILELAATIIDNSQYYRDIFNSRIF